MGEPRNWIYNGVEIKVDDTDNLKATLSYEDQEVKIGRRGDIKDIVEFIPYAEAKAAEWRRLLTVHKDAERSARVAKKQLDEHIDSMSRDS